MNSILHFLSTFGPAPTLLQILIMFGAIWANDLSWANYIRKTSSGKPIPAGAWAIAVWITGAIAVVSYTTNHWLVVLGAIATFVGTSFFVWMDSRKSREHR